VTSGRLLAWEWRVLAPDKEGPDIIFFVKPSIGTHKKDEKGLLGSADE
jgi:hypothetical protein